ncbi:ETC complex I subunit conserved region-domain-containing protein [Chytriomyces sp. MP71]|nr:ETC complex I subunit conserved region-domain-containing protein [Chytriomyces sp. MP71]
MTSLRTKMQRAVQPTARLLAHTARASLTTAAAGSGAVAEVLDERRLYQAELLSGAPASLTRHAVRIYRPANTPTQNGSARANHWRIDFDAMDRWENSLMGWASSADPVQALSVKFLTKEDAVLFAERQGYDYWVDLPKEGNFVVKSYSQNFKYSPKKLRYLHTK